MINKPINPYPHNCCVDVTRDWNVEYEIPNNEKIDGYCAVVDNLENGNNVVSNYAVEEYSWYGVAAPELPSSSGMHSVCVLDGIIYLFCGGHLYKYEDDSWLQLSSTAQSELADIVAYRGSIWGLGSIFGRWTGDGWTTSSTTYQWDSGADFAVYDDKIHAIGGSINGYSSHYVFSCDSTDTLVVEQLPDTPFSAKYHSVIGTDDGLYCAFGYDSSSTFNQLFYKYDGTEWKEIGNAPYLARNVSMVCHDGFIHALGGNGVISGASYYDYHAVWDGSSWKMQNALPYAFASFERGSVAVSCQNKIHIVGSSGHYSDHTILDTMFKPTNQVVWDVSPFSSEYNNKEFSWSSFYWKTPTKTPTSTRVISGYDTSMQELFLRPEFKEGASRVMLKPTTWGTGSVTEEGIMIADLIPSPQYTIEYRTADSTPTYNEDIYSKDCGHTIGDDTSFRCYKGQLEDYFGFSYFVTREALLEKIRSVGVGKCVIEVYEAIGDGSSKLVAQARVLAYDVISDNLAIIIIDNNDFRQNLEGRLLLCQYASDNQVYFYRYDFLQLYGTDAMNSRENIGGLMKHNDKYYLIKDCRFKDYYYLATIYNSLPEDVLIGDKVDVWSHDGADFNTTPTYYFRSKMTPTVSVTHYGVLTNNTLQDIKGNFGINYDSTYVDSEGNTIQGCGLNYFYLYMFVLDERSGDWQLVERSPMMHDIDDTYEFVGFVDGQRYKVCAICTDKDGDEWTTDELIFDISNPPISTYNFAPTFNKKTTTIELVLDDMLAAYNSASLEFYRILKNDMESVQTLDYAGGGLSKSDGVVYFNKWCDYNIKNDSYYDYYVRVNYTGKESDTDEGTDWILVASDMHTKFEGTSILGLEKVSSTKLGIANCFNLFYHFDNSLGELTNEIGRDYINSFNKYPKELKGHQNYISGSCTGLLGGMHNGIYEEPRGIRNAWNNFVNDDTIKLYRGLDGETMIVSIDTNRVKPFYFPSAGLVNEVSITFKEIASANQYAIFTTEKIGG